MSYIPEVAWSTIASNVTLGASAYRYYITVNPLDPNEAGASTMTMAVDDWFIDFAGYPFLIEEVNGSILTVYDILERGDGVVSAYAPYANKLGYVYRPLNGAIILTQAQLRKLDTSAVDIIYPIEKGIVWGYRGLQLSDGTVALTNVTKLELVGLSLTNNNTPGWQGGSELTLTASLIGLSDVTGVTSQGCLIYGTSSSEFGLLPKSTSTNYYLKNSGTDNNPSWASITDSDLVLSDITTNNASITKHGFLPKLPNDTSKWLRGDGSWTTISTDYGNFLDSVIRMVVDNSFDPSPTTTGDRYILETTSLHTNFGTITGLGVHDIVQYNGSAFTVVFDASAAASPATVTVGIDKNGASNHDWTYNVTDDIWIDRGTTTLHNSLSDLNTGVGQYYHLTSDQQSLVAGITSSYSELNYLDGTTVTSGRILFGDGIKITNDSNLYWDYTNDRLSIGTATPVYKFVVSGTNASPAHVGIIATDTSATYIRFGYSGEYNAGIAYQSTATGFLSLRTGGHTASEDRLVIKDTGISYFTNRLGIKTTLPIYDLDVNGTARIGTLNGLIYGTSGVLSAISGTGFVKSSGTTITFDNSSYQPLDATLTSLASVSGVQGDLLYASGTDTWTRLAKSTTANSFLKNSGTNNNPVWSTIAFDDLSDVVLTTPTQGSLLYFNGTNWVNLAPGTSGYFLKTQGTGANPIWAASTVTPGGSDTYVQFNDAGNFGGVSGLIFNKITNALTCTGVVTGSNITAGNKLYLGTTTPPITDTGTLNALVWDNTTGEVKQRTITSFDYYQSSVTSSSTPTPVGSHKENEYYLTTLAVSATFAAPSGTPANGNTLLIRIKDNGTARTLAWNSIYRAVGVTLPTTTTASRMLYIGCIYNSTDSKWDVVSVVKQV